MDRKEKVGGTVLETSRGRDSPGGDPNFRAASGRHHGNPASSQLALALHYDGA